MSIEAFWCLSFHSNNHNIPENAGFGVVIFESGRVFGGDSNFYYNGTYLLNGGNITAKVRVKRFAAGMPSITGLDDYVLIIGGLSKGSYNDDEFMVDGHVENVPQAKVYVGFKRIENLP